MLKTNKFNERNMKKYILLSFLLIQATFASNVDISNMSDKKLKDILEEIEVQVTVKHDEALSTNKELRFHISQYRTFLWQAGWETNAGCELNKSGNEFKCNMGLVDMADIARALASKNYYEISFYSPFSTYYCDDIQFDRNDLRITKENFWPFTKYKLNITLNECNFE